MYLLHLSFLLDAFALLCRKKKCLLFQQPFELVFCHGSEWNTPLPDGQLDYAPPGSLTSSFQEVVLHDAGQSIPVFLYVTVLLSSRTEQ